MSCLTSMLGRKSVVTRPRRSLAVRIALLAACTACGETALAAPLHTTYLWHMHQPIYWPAESAWHPGEYEKAYETITLGHSESNVFDIFDKDDRVHDYQEYPRAAIFSILDLPDAGARISSAGALAANLFSLGDNGWNGGRYSSDWYRSVDDLERRRRRSASGGRGLAPFGRAEPGRTGRAVRRLSLAVHVGKRERRREARALEIEVGPPATRRESTTPLSRRCRRSSRRPRRFEPASRQEARPDAPRKRR